MDNLHQSVLAELGAAPLALDESFPLGPVVEALSAGTFEAVPRTARPPTLAEAGIGLLPPLDGLLLYTTDILGTSIRAWTESVKAVGANPRVKKVLGLVNSPGGTTTGLPEAWKALKRVAEKKPVLMVAMPLMASAAYHIASAATRILSLRSGNVGSIGAFATHTDLSEAYKKAGVRFTHITSDARKVELSNDQPLSADAKRFHQAQVDALTSTFKQNVATGRGVPLARVNEWASGRLFLAEDALRMGLVDELVDSTQRAVSTIAAELTYGQRECKERRDYLVKACGGPVAYAAMEREWKAEAKAKRDEGRAQAAERRAYLRKLDVEIASFTP